MKKIILPLMICLGALSLQAGQASKASKVSKSSKASKSGKHGIAKVGDRKLVVDPLEKPKEDVTDSLLRSGEEVKNLKKEHIDNFHDQEDLLKDQDPRNKIMKDSSPNQIKAKDNIKWDYNKKRAEEERKKLEKFNPLEGEGG